MNRTRVLITLLLMLTLLTSMAGMPVSPNAHAAAPSALALSPNAVVAGTTSNLTVHGSGFTPNSRVTLRYDAGKALGSATTAADGTFTASVTIAAAAVPDGAIGPHRLQATDAAGLSTSAPLAVVGLSLSSPMAPPEAEITIGGSGFLPNQPFVIHLGDRVVLTGRTDRSGGFADKAITIPAGLAGTQPLQVASGSARAVSGVASGLTARITFPVTRATLTLDPTVVPAGKTIAVHGTGFAAHATLRLALGPLALGTVSTDATGAFAPATFVVPATVAAGRHTVGITDRGGHALATAVLTVQIPIHAATATPTATHTVVPAVVATHTTEPTASHTVLPTATHTPRPTATQIRLTATAAPRATHTVAPTATHTPRPTATQIRLTATAAPRATHTVAPTATATHTAVPATAPTPVPAVLGIHPSTVLAGGTITVSGQRFLAGEPIDIQLATAAGAGALHLAYTTANASGSFRLSGLTIPATTPRGAYQITAIGQRSSRNARAPLQIIVPQATLRVQPTTFAPQENIHVAGANFLPGEPVSLILSTRAGTAAVVLGQVVANRAGAFDITALHVPFGVPSGALQVVASGQRSNRQAILPVTVRAQAPTLASSATNVKPSVQVALTGSHFQPGETVTVDLVALAFSTRLGTVQVSSGGTFTLANVAIPPNTPQGTASLVATGISSHLSAAAQIQVGALPATLMIAPTRLIAGSALSLTARGFIAGETTVAQLANGLLRLTLATAVVDTGGAVHLAKLVIPAFVPAGAYTLAVFGQISGRSASTKLTVQARPRATPILSILAPASGTPIRLSPGSLVLLAASRFPANAPVTIVLAGAGRIITLGVVLSAASGTFGPVGLTVPANTPAGVYSLLAQIGGQAAASVAVQVASLNPTLTVAPVTVKPGTTVTIRGNGFAPGEQVVLALNGAALVTAPAAVLANGSGAFIATVVTPGTVNDAANILTAVGVSSRAGRSVTLQGRLPVASRWYLPNGDTTGDHRTVLALLNPSDGAARVTLTFLYQNAPERHTTLQVAAHARASVDLALVAGAGRIISTIVEADRQIGADSTISYGGGDTSTAIGAGAPATRWYLAEGFTGKSFRESLVVMNPNTSYAIVDVRFLPFNGRPLREVRFLVSPRANIQIDVGQYMPGLSVSAIVTADKGVVVERSMRFGLGQRGAHDQVGATGASTVWLFAQGDTSPGRQTFLTILNPNQATLAAVTATFYGMDGRPAGASTILVDPLRRGNIKLNDVLPHGTVAVVVTSNVPVVVESPQYEGPADLNRASSGTDVFGQNGGATSWLFPGGSIGTGSQELLYLFNPGLKPVQVRITLYAATGASVQRTLAVAANSRSTLDLTSIGGLLAGPVGVRLQSTNGQVFIGERAEMNPALQTASSTQGIAQ